MIVEREDRGLRHCAARGQARLARHQHGADRLRQRAIVAEDDILGDLLTGGFSHRAANHANLLSHVATSVGCAQGLFDKTMGYVQERRLYGKDISQTATGQLLAGRSATQSTAACCALLHDTVRAFEAGHNPDM